MENIKKDDVVKFIMEKVCELTKQSKDAITEETDLASIGMDSLRAVMMCGYIEEAYSIEVEPILMFEHKTANDAADAVLAIMEEQA